MPVTPFAKQLQAWRDESGLTQKQIAVLMNVTQQSVGGWLQGEGPGADKLPRLAQVLGVSESEMTAAWMASKQEAPTPPPTVTAEQRQSITQALNDAPDEVWEQVAQIVDRQARSG